MLFPDYMRWRTLHQEGNVTSAGEHYFRKGRLYKVGDVRPGRECYLSWGGGGTSGRERCVRWGCYLRKRISLELGDVTSRRERYLTRGTLIEVRDVASGRERY